MHRRPLSVVPALAVVSLGILGLAAQAASASPSAPPGAKGGPAPVAAGSTAPSSKLPAAPAGKAFTGYQQVTSALLSDPAGLQVSGTATCPVNTKVVGGGAVISSTSLAENLNVSVPQTDGRTWRVFVNNTSGTAGTFRVYANCVKRVPGGQVVVGTGVSNAAGTQTSASVSCPAPTVPLGGGGFTSSSSTAVNLNTSIPTSTGWRVDANNASTSSNTVTAYAVCGTRPTGYVQVVGSSTTVNAGTQASSIASCPAGRAVLGGGAFSSSALTSVNLNTSVPSGSAAWIAYENNGSASGTTVTGYAVCARTV